MAGMKPYYDDGRGIQIFLGDCREVLPTLETASADLVLTDPPYGVGKAEWDSVFPTYWIAEAFRCSPRMICMTGNSALMVAGHALGYQYRDCLVLHALNGMTRSKVAFGNWIPAIVAGDWKWEGRPNLITFVVDSKEEKINHPSPKPLQAIKKLLGYYSKEDWRILDPFMGSGTTLLASKALGRKAIGIEIEERYCEISAKRLAAEFLPFPTEAACDAD